MTEQRKTWIDKMTFRNVESLNQYRANGALPVESVISIETIEGGSLRVWYYKPEGGAESS
ncbi:hypothetical protein [Xanthomonas axonopodis]|uniref:hypothetical protein n=1 Tax=Xanthomonas axonopodis TaxID=53413 RepID=UPI003558EDE2